MESHKIGEEDENEEERRRRVNQQMKNEKRLEAAGKAGEETVSKKEEPESLLGQRREQFSQFINTGSGVDASGLSETKEQAIKEKSVVPAESRSTDINNATNLAEIKGSLPIIPTLKLHKPNVVIKISKVNFEIPEIKKKNVREPIIPFVKLQPAIIAGRRKLDFGLPAVKKSRKLIIPVMVTKSTSNYTIQTSHFDMEILEPEIKHQIVVVPLINIKRPITTSIKTPFASEVSMPQAIRPPHLPVPAYTLAQYSMPSISIREFDIEVVKLSKTTQTSTNIPVVNVAKPPNHSIKISEFDVRPALSKVRKPYESAVPTGQTAPSTPVEPDKEVVFSGVKTEEKDELEKVTMKEKQSEAGSASAGAVPPSTDSEEIPDFLDTVFEGDGRKIMEDGPKIILFKDLKDDSYIHFLENICLRIYREKEGGKPVSKKILKIDESSKKEIEMWLEAGHKIFTINLGDEKEKFDILDKTRLLERLEETWTSSTGFIIFYTKNDTVFDRFDTILQEIADKTKWRLKIIKLKAKMLPRELIGLVSGMLDLKKHIEGYIEKGKLIRNGEQIATFDSIINKALFNNDSIFNTILYHIDKLFYSATSRAKLSEKKEESDIHFKIKVFLVKYLAKKYKVDDKSRKEIRRKIKTEVKLYEDIVPDVMISEGGNTEVYEVETLFGEGSSPLKKIDETIDKYSEKNVPVTSLNIVIDNFGALLHLKDLLVLRKLRQEESFKVEFYTLDLENQRLVPLTVFAKEFKRIIGS